LAQGFKGRDDNRRTPPSFKAMAVNRLPARGLRLLPCTLAAVVVLGVVRFVSDRAFAAVGSSRQALSLSAVMAVVWSLASS